MRKSNYHCIQYLRELIRLIGWQPSRGSGGNIHWYTQVLAVQKHAAEVLVFFPCGMELAELLDVRGTGECLGGA